MQKRAIIIGATSGIGHEVALRLHADGWTIGIAGRREELLKEMASSLNQRVVYLPIDVTASDAALKLRQLISLMGGADLLFLAAGIGWQNPSLDETKELRTVETNALGFTRIITAAYNYFASEGKGHIACISSIAGTKGLGSAPAYSATKRFQNSYIQCLAQLSRMNHHNICFTDIRPGFVDTPLISGSHYPMQMKPSDVAEKIVKAIYSHRRVVTIDWRYRILVALWRAIPNCLWERITFIK